MPFPSPGCEELNTMQLIRREIPSIGKLTASLWLQARLMYNYSNTPRAATTTLDTTSYYGFSVSADVQDKPTFNTWVLDIWGDFFLHC